MSSKADVLMLVHNLLILIFRHPQVSSSGKAILITGCESPLAWYLCKKLDDIGFAVFAGFKNVVDNAEAELLKDECSARVRVLQIDASSEVQVRRIDSILGALTIANISVNRCTKR